jgi:hypothetical protein
MADLATTEAGTRATELLAQLRRQWLEYGVFAR